MHTELPITVQNHKEKRNSLAEVSNVEKQLWISVQSRGLLNADVRSLYHKTCGLYEKIFIGNNELEELQETEYSLWKFHYKHIDEFRRQTSKNPESIQEGFKLFLEEASRFYRDLISKFKRYYGFEDRILFYQSQNDSLPRSLEHVKLHKCRFLCHRLLVRLGDLVRYLEVNKNSEIHQRNWCCVAQCYFEAAKMYPDSGNPQNQLALLATPAYIGDEFLALYHCVRSIAVKEPFPDASDNLLFIFEMNMSAHISSLSVGLQFNFLKPSQRVMTSDYEAIEGACCSDADFWSLFVRLTGFFFLEFSFESFSCTFASTIRELEAFLALDDAKLSIKLESYQNVNISRPGPYRAIQLVSVLIFTAHNLSKNHKHQCLMKLQMVLTATFIFMGRIVERCLLGISIDDPLLLPTVMVFSEWLVEVLETVEKCESDENLTTAITYFFSSFAKLLNQLFEYKNQAESESESSNAVALWEDYEMRGFLPVLDCHSFLDFFSHCENEVNFRARNEIRVHRILQAAIKIANRSTDSNQSWIFYVKGGKFYTKESHLKETQEEDEEEDIVFKPNSYQEIRKGPEQSAFDESLRLASSRLIAQNRALINSLTSSPAHTGPPSLNAWVFNDNNKGDILSLTKKASRYIPPAPSAPLIPEDANWSKLSNYIEPLPPLPPWPRILGNRKNLPLINNNKGSVQFQQGSYTNHGLNSVPAVYTESTVSMHPMPPFANGLYHQRRENAFFDQQRGYGTELNVGENQQQLLQYLKEKEWRIQQESRVRDYTNTRR